MTTDAAIRVEGMQKSDGGLHVLRVATFDVAPGSIFALLGSNGAGKTTVVRILATLLKADAGTARVNGFDVVTGAPDVSARPSPTRPITPSTRGNVDADPTSMTTPSRSSGDGSGE